MIMEYVFGGGSCSTDDDDDSKETIVVARAGAEAEEAENIVIDNSLRSEAERQHEVRRQSPSNDSSTNDSDRSSSSKNSKKNTDGAEFIASGDSKAQFKIDDIIELKLLLANQQAKIDALELANRRLKNLEVENARLENELNDRREGGDRNNNDDHRREERQKELEWTIDALERSDRHRRRLESACKRTREDLRDAREREATLRGERRELESQNAELLRDNAELRMEMGNLSFSTKKIMEVNFGGRGGGNRNSGLRRSHDTTTTWASTEESVDMDSVNI
mmetsp:Transcript_26883/g.57160  ORF Transcript_26883/g.57160 Transcript_26883/m.57160 type:complete len:279 (-) Transcript_26883:101-937(-)